MNTEHDQELWGYLFPLLNRIPTPREKEFIQKIIRDTVFYLEHPGYAVSAEFVDYVTEIKREMKQDYAGQVDHIGHRSRQNVVTMDREKTNG